MSKIVVLDSGPLGLLCSVRPYPDVIACKLWVIDLRTAGHRVIVPEITDYEIRRELIRLGRARSIGLLDDLHRDCGYLPLDTATMQRAAELWAFARQTGQPTAGDDTIDADMILVAQAESLNDPSAIIASTNVGHLGRFFPAEVWANITP